MVSSKEALAPTGIKFRLRTALVVPFVLQIVTAVGLVGYLSFRNGQKAVNELVLRLENEASSRIYQHLDTFLATPAQINQINVDDYESGNLNLLDYERTGRRFHSQMKTLKSLNYMGFGRPQGSEYVGIGREADGRLYMAMMRSSYKGRYKQYELDSQGNPTRVTEHEAFEYVNESGFTDPVKAGKPVWAKINYWADRPDIVTISCSHPVYDKSRNLVGVIGTELFLPQLNPFLQNLKVSPSGKIFILERDGLVVATSTSEKSYQIKEGKPERLNVLELKDPLIRATGQHLRDRFGNFSQINESQQLKFNLNNESKFVQVLPWRDKLGLDWLIVVVIPESDFMGQINHNNRITILLCLLTLGVAIAIGILTARSIANPMLRLTQASKELADGNLDRRVHTSELVELEEIETLEQSFNSMARQLQESFETLEDKVKERTVELATANAEISVLNERLKEENLRLSAEVEVARQIQQMILPKPEELEIEGLDIAGYMEPADEVGGDYYDVLYNDGVVTIGIGDVTGHGLESGILMLMTQTAVRTLKEVQEHDPVKFLDSLNRTIYKNVQRMNSQKNLTLAVLNYAEGAVSISGQHEETIVVRNGGRVERIDTMNLGFPIGLDDDIADFISQTIVELKPGDGIVVYTDGIPEAKNMDKKQYGIEPLCEVISDNWHKSALEIKDAIIADVRQFIGKQKVFDDITLLVLKRQDDASDDRQNHEAIASNAQLVLSA